MTNFAKGKSAYVFTTEEAKEILGLSHLENKVFLDRIRRADVDTVSKKGKSGYTLFSYNGLRFYHDLRTKNSSGQYEYTFNTPQWVMDRINEAGSETAEETRPVETIDWSERADNLAKFLNITVDEVMNKAITMLSDKVKAQELENIKKEEQKLAERKARTKALSF